MTSKIGTNAFLDEEHQKLSKDEEKAYLEIIKEIQKTKPNKKQVEMIKREIGKKYGLKHYPRNSDILRTVPNEIYDEVVSYLRVRNVRSLSGVNVISVFTAPFACRHGACIFCPGGPSWGTPMSYTGREPGAMRAISNGFDPIAQINSRINQLQATGHNAEKLDIIIMGGTFNSTPKEYQEQFVMGIYEGMNGIPSKTLEEAKTINENAKHRCVGLTIETKPDWARPYHIKKMLDFGTTRVEIGVQTLQEDVLKYVNRGHTLQDTIESFKALRDAGLKITAHMMPGLPGTTSDIDIEDFRTLYYDPKYIPDEIKIYPTQVIENTPLAQMVIDGKYKGLTNEETYHIVKEVKLMTPPFIRIKRAVRDLPVPMIISGTKWADMRHRIQNEFKRYKDLRCQCIRCREVGLSLYKDEIRSEEIGPFEKTIRTYEAGDGIENFLSYEDKNNLIAGFLRLRYPSEDNFISNLRDSAIVRELHVYGSALPLEDPNDPYLEESFQHKGYGKSLLSWAEDLTKDKGYQNLAVISGVGVRDYYRKLGYELSGSYMIKNLE